MESMSKEEDSKGELIFSRLSQSWFAAEKSTLVFAASLPTGLSLAGLQKNRKTFVQSIGQADFHALATAPDGTIWAAEKNYVWKWENATESGGYQADDGRLYIPRLRIFTSDLGIRDMSVDGLNTLLMASGGYSVIGRATTGASFEFVWKPSFISKVAREDRCGLSGIGLYDSDRHCVTLRGRSDKELGWKEGFDGGGCVMMIKDSSVLCEGLCLPCAPRWHNNELYLLNTGTAEFGKVDQATKRFVPICQCPGYPTGIAFLRQWAVVALSSTPPEGTLDLTLPATAAFVARKATPFNGVLIVDLRSGDIAHHAYREDAEFHVSSVAVLPECPTAKAIGQESPHLDSLVTTRRKSKEEKS